VAAREQIRAMLQFAFENAGVIWALYVGAFALAVAVPALVLFARHEVRLRRLRQIEDFLYNFNFHKAGKSALADNPSFEFARSKYTADLKFTPEERSRLAKGSESEKFATLIEAAELRRTHFGIRLTVSASFFIFISFAGFALLIYVLDSQLATDQRGSQREPIANILIIALLTFIGAYVSSIRLLMSRLSLFDISSNTFLRVASETLASVMISVILYAALSDPIAALTGTAPTGTGRGMETIPPIWLALAVAIGLLPESATRFLLSKIQNKISFFKTTDERFNELTKVTSPEVIDGIDYEARFRLQDCGIYDVQNLATYNPILLYIETPYGIYQCIDWIAQAQLCNIVGLERFMIFRELNVRTIFDLERAIDSKQSPCEFDDIYISVLLAPTMRLRQAADIGKAKFVVARDAVPAFKNVDEFCDWCRASLSKNPETLTRATEHLLTWMTDDLHVRRLRRLWNEISDSLGPEAEYLPDSKRARHAQPSADRAKLQLPSPLMFWTALVAHLLMSRKSG